MFACTLKRIMLIMICWVVGAPVAYAQTKNKIDSLNNVLQSATTDTARITGHNRLAKEYFLQRDSALAFQHAYSALALAGKTSSRYHKAHADQILGYLHTVLLHKDSAMFYNNRVISRLEHEPSLEDLRLIVYATNNNSSIYAVNGHVRQSAEMLISNLPRLEKLQDNWGYGITIQNITACFTNMGEYQKAYPYMRKALGVIEKGKFSPPEKIGAYLTATHLMIRMDSLDKVNEYLQKAKIYLDEIGNPVPASGRYYSYQAFYYAHIRKPKEANAMLAKAEEALQQFSSRMNYYDYYFAKKNVMLWQGDYQGARDAALQVYKLSEEDHNNEIKLGSAKEIAEYAWEAGDYKTAYGYMKKYAEFADSLKYAQTVLEVHDLETKYQTAEKEKKITRLQVEKEQAILKSKNQYLLNLLLGGGAGVLLLITLFLIYFYRNSKQQAAQQLREMEQQQHLQLTQTMLEAEERERTRVARDLHDGLGGTLSGIKLKLSAEQKPHSPVVEDVILQLEEAIGELRTIARNMMPESLIRLGLEAALRDLCASLSDRNREIEFQASSISKELPLVSQVNIYRIIQELLANAIRHSHATKIIVQCIQDHNNFLITVEDNGSGFNLDSARKAKGIGLSNIYTRVNYVKGKIDITSVINEGTSVNIELYV
ncbi:sensor histidine kinase [Chitinophaga sp. Mgbs1]|uniref:histidine kinase n=1 Tax=Chitinophaga solisilvae TaxID=1233460 RepID=A0A3S1AYR0_9BACT|nr:sensor histidine kinase [Chitinophaga solisilvae]